MMKDLSSLKDEAILFFKELTLAQQNDSELQAFKSVSK